VYGFLLSLYYLGSGVLRGVCPSLGDSRIGSESLSGCRGPRYRGKRPRRIVEALGLDDCCLEGAQIVERDLLQAGGSSLLLISLRLRRLGISHTRSSGSGPLENRVF
jgi:hypothetical protein